MKLGGGDQSSRQSGMFYGREACFGRRVPRPLANVCPQRRPPPPSPSSRSSSAFPRSNDNDLVSTFMQMRRRLGGGRRAARCLSEARMSNGARASPQDGERRRWVGGEEEQARWGATRRCPRSLAAAIA